VHKAVQGACAEGKEDVPASAKQEEAVVVKQEGADGPAATQPKAESGPAAAPAPPQAEPGLAALLAAFPPRGEYIAAEDETPVCAPSG